MDKKGTEVDITLEPSVGSGGKVWANTPGIEIVKTNAKTSLFLICRILNQLYVSTKMGCKNNEFTRSILPGPGKLEVTH